MSVAHTVKVKVISSIARVFTTILFCGSFKNYTFEIVIAFKYIIVIQINIISISANIVVKKRYIR